MFTSFSDVELKATLLAATFLIDYLHFEVSGFCIKLHYDVIHSTQEHLHVLITVFFQADPTDHDDGDD